MHSGEYNGMTNLYGFSASDATAAFKGDVAAIDTTHRTTALTDPYAPGIPLISALSNDVTTTKYRGVIAGFVPQPEYNMSVTASLGTMYRLASTARYAWVVDDYLTIFEVQEYGNSYVDATNNLVNKGVDLAGAGSTGLTSNTTTGISCVQVDSPGTSQLPFKVLRYTQRVDNFNFSASDTNSYAKVDVVISNGDLGPAGAVVVGA
jgi:hypothetical protein